MKIRKLQLKNIGVFDDETIEFQKCPKGKAEIHIFTGQNGSGKTTLLQTLAGLFSLDTREDDFRLTFNISRNNIGKRFRNKKSTYITYEVEDNKVSKSFGFHINKSEGDHFFQPVVDFGEDSITKKLKSFSSRLITKKSLRYWGLSFSAFAYSSYRLIKSERIELNKDKANNPLEKALDFEKEEIPHFTINQWLANSLSKRALAKEENSKEANKFDENIKNLEKTVEDVIGRKISFKLKTNLSLVLVDNGEELDFDVLPDGLKSLISWIGDLLMRLDSLKWENDTPIFEREIILFLDEIEVHLHPAWQRKVLPVVQKLFKNSQIFVSTHSPFVVNSVDDAWIYKLELEDGKAKVGSIERSEDARSYRYVLRNTFDIDSEFGVEIEKRLEDFYRERDILLAGNGNSKKAKTELKKIAKELSSQSKELKTKIDFELFQLSEITGEKF